MKPRRRLLLSALGAGAAAAMLRAAGQPAPGRKRIGYLANSIAVRDLTDRSSSMPGGSLFEAGLRERGWEDGRNVSIVWKSAEGAYDRLPALAAELVSMPVDVIVAFGDGVTAASAQTRTIPIVGLFGSLGDGSLSRMPPNVTGVTREVGSAFSAQRLALLKELSPQVSRVAFLVTKAAPIEPRVRQAARDAGLSVFEVEVTDRPTPERVALAIDHAALRDGANGLIVRDFPAAHWPEFQRAMHVAAARHRLPVIHTVLSAADSGGLAAYGVDIFENVRRVPYYVDKILRGARPADLPIEQQNRFQLVLNLKTARAMGLNVPSSIASQAQRVIE